MKLTAYLEVSGESLSSVAGRAGISRITLAKIRDGGSCQTRTLDKVSAACAGKVSREELLPPQKRGGPRARRAHQPRPAPARRAS